MTMFINNGWVHNDKVKIMAKKQKKGNNIMLLKTSKKQAIFCYKKDKERLLKHIKRLIPLLRDYKENKPDYLAYVYDEELGDYIKNDKLVYLNIMLEDLNNRLRVVGLKEIDDVYNAKDDDNIIDYLDYLIERDLSWVTKK